MVVLTVFHVEHYSTVVLIASAFSTRPPVRLCVSNGFSWLNKGEIKSSTGKLNNSGVSGKAHCQRNNSND